MNLDWGTVGLLFALTLTACFFARRSPTMPIAISLAVNILFCVVSVYALGDEAETAANAVAEMAIIVICALVLIDRPLVVALVLLLSLASCIATVLRLTERMAIAPYERITNGILVVQCFVVILTEFLNAASDSVARVWRWYRHRRRVARVCSKELASPSRGRAR